MFQFSMEKILDWRTDLEKEAKRSLASAQQELQSQHAILQNLLVESRQLKNESLKTKQINALRSHDLYKELLNDKIIHQKNTLAAVEKDVELAQIRLLETHKDKKIMEKLKDKELEKQIELEKSEEQKQMDEIGSLSFGKNLY